MCGRDVEKANFWLHFRNIVHFAEGTNLLPNLDLHDAATAQQQIEMVQREFRSS